MQHEDKMRQTTGNSKEKGREKHVSRREEEARQTHVQACAVDKIKGR